MARVAFFPSVTEMAANPYWPRLADALGQRGVELDSSFPTDFSLGSLWAGRATGVVLHFHYIQQFYSYEQHHARLRWVLRFARNLLLARLLGYTTVFTVHNVEPTYGLRPTWVDALGHWCAVNLTTSVIVHCAATQAAVRGRYGRRRNVHIVEHAGFVDTYPQTMDTQSARARLGLEADHTVFAFVGGIRPNKGVHELISAFSALPGDEFRLVVAGRPWPPDTYIDSLKAAVARDPRIQLRLEHIPDQELQIYFKAADAIVLPFENITTSGSAILAMSMGRAVVAPALGCLPELIADGAGVLYDPKTPQALLGALRRCREQDLRKMGQAAYARVCASSWELMAQETASVYRSGPRAGLVSPVTGAAG